MKAMIGKKIMLIASMKANLTLVDEVDVTDLLFHLRPFI